MSTENETMDRKGADVLQYTIYARMYGQTYIARVSGEDFRASCTMGSQQAAETCATKFCAARRLVQTELLRCGKSDAWVLCAVPRKTVES